MFVHISPGVHKAQESMQEPLNLHLQVVVSLQVWVLGTNQTQALGER